MKPCYVAMFLYQLQSTYGHRSFSHFLNILHGKELWHFQLNSLYRELEQGFATSSGMEILRSSSLRCHSDCPSSVMYMYVATTSNPRTNVVTLFEQLHTNWVAIQPEQATNSFTARLVFSSIHTCPLNQKVYCSIPKLY